MPMGKLNFAFRAAPFPVPLVEPARVIMWPVAGAQVTVLKAGSQA